MFKRKYSIKDIESSVSMMAPKRSEHPIAIIDDEDYPIKILLQNMGYVVTHLLDIKTVQELEPYSIVVCDIRNVGKSFDSKYGGAYIVKELKNKYPQKYIIICSGSVFKVDFNEYFKLADKSIKKGADSSEWSKILDVGIKELTSPRKIWERTRLALIDQKMNVKIINQLEQAFIRSIVRKDVEVLNQLVNKHSKILIDEKVKFIINTLSATTANILSKIILG